MGFIIGYISAAVISGLLCNREVKKHQRQIRDLEVQHNTEMFSKQLEITQANVQLAIEQCRQIRESKEDDLKLYDEIMNKLNKIEG